MASVSSAVKEDNNESSLGVSGTSSSTTTSSNSNTISLGIELFLTSKGSKFSCSVKSLYSDFTVQEISTNGLVASPKGKDDDKTMQIYDKYYKTKADAEQKADQMSDDDRLSAFIQNINTLSNINNSNNNNNDNNNNNINDEHVKELTEWMAEAMSGGKGGPTSHIKPYTLPLPIPDKQVSDRKRLLI